MEGINNDMTQEDYDKIMAEITNLELLEIVNGEEHSKEIAKLKRKIEYED